MTVASFLAALFALQSPPAAVPLDVQLPALLKALSFDRSLAAAEGDLVIGLVYDPSDPISEGAKDRLLSIHRELTRLRVKGRQVHLAVIAFTSGATLPAVGAKVMIVAPLSSAALESVARDSARSDVLTFATEVSYVDRGLAMGMEMDAGRPRFVVNLAVAAEAGASFESGFLNLCRIVEK